MQENSSAVMDVEEIQEMDRAEASRAAAEGQSSLDLSVSVRPRYKRVSLTEIPEKLSGPDPSKGLVDSMRDQGLFQPVGLEETADGGYLLGWGRRRIKAARALEWMDIPAFVYPEGSGIVHLATIGENEHRQDNDVATFDAINDLLVDHGLQSPAELCRQLGLKPPKVSKLLRLRNLLPELLQAFRDDVLSTSAAYQAARLPHPVQAALVEQLQESGRLTVAEVLAAQQARAQREIAGALLPDIFDTPSAEQAEEMREEPAFPVREGRKTYDTLSDLEAALHALVAPLAIAVDSDGRRWKRSVQVSVTYEPEA